MSARQSDYARAWIHRIAGDIPEQVQEVCRPYERAYARVWTRLIAEAKETGLIREDIDTKVAQQLIIGALNTLSYSWKSSRTASVNVVVLSAQEILLSGLSFEERDWSAFETSPTSSLS
jgi:TetR/AcrR family transcriptional regulator, cholesterol catabolism regulator